MQDVHREAEAALKWAAEDMKRFYDRKKRDSVEYSKGDQVWLEGTNIKTKRPAKKLDYKHFGPFKIKCKVGSSGYELTLPKTWSKIHPIFHKVLLSPFKPPTSPSQQKPPPPPEVVVDGVPELEVETIEDSRLRRGKVEYLVKWKGYP